MLTMFCWIGSKSYRAFLSADRLLNILNCHFTITLTLAIYKWKYQIKSCPLVRGGFKPDLPI